MQRPKILYDPVAIRAVRAFCRAQHLMPPVLSVRIERWPLAAAFTISRGAKTEAVVVVAEVSDGDICGRGECVPYPNFTPILAK